LKINLINRLGGKTENKFYRLNPRRFINNIEHLDLVIDG